MSGGLQVVVADDDPLQRAWLAGLLRRLGHRPVEAADGETALARLAETGARALICDLRMPGLDGRALTARLRAGAAGRYVHVVMVTGADEAAVRRDALAAGVDDFLRKPVDAPLLTARMAVVERLVRHEDLLVERTERLDAARRALDGDLRDAARAQARLLPPPVLDLPGARVASAVVASSWVSGDMLGAFALPGGRTGFYALDVSGHGVRAALTSVAVGHLLAPETFARHAIGADGRPDPAGVARMLDARLAGAGDDYLTLACGVVDPDAGLLHLCRAGHPPAPFLRPGTAPVLLDAPSFPVALVPHARFDTVALPFGPGDLLVLASDGAIEAEAPDGTPWGARRLAREADAARPGGVAAIPGAILAALDAWRGGAPPADDLAILALESRSPR